MLRLPKTSTILPLICLLIFSACGVDKNGKLKPVSRFGKDLGTQYNGHYNANAMMDEYILSAEAQVQDAYDDVLPIYGYIKDSSSSRSSSLDVETIEAKMTRLASFKRPSKWTDDVYLTFGKAQYLAGNYIEAENTLKYILQNYQPQDLKHIYYYKEDKSKRRIYAQARLEQEEARKAAKIERELEKARRLKEKEQIKMLGKKEKKLAEKQKKLELKERQDLRKQQEKIREDLRKEREKARKKGDRSYDKEYVKQRRQEMEDALVEETKTKKVSKKKKYEEREERLRQKRLALLNKDKEEQEDQQKLDSFELEEITFEADIVKGQKDSMTYDEKREQIEKRKEQEAELLAGENGEDSLADEAIEDTLLAAIGEEFIPTEATRGVANVYFFEEAFYADKQTNINSTNESLVRKVAPHDPAFYEAMVYLAHVENQLGSYYQSEAYMKELFGYEMPRDVQDKALLAIAENYIQRQDYAAADKALELAIDANSISRKEKGRYSFIRGQLLEKMGNRNAAQVAYAEVSKYHPGAEMELRAELKQLSLSLTSSNIDAIAKQLERLGKDDRMVEFQDIIYLDLGIAHLRSKNYSAAEEALRKSSAANLGRQYEKYKAMALLSDMFYRQKDYVQAYNYADTISRMNATERMKAHDKYVSRSSDLRNIAEGLVTIQEQDSLLTLGQLSDKELKKMAKKILREERQKELAKQIREERETENAVLNASSSRNNLRRNTEIGLFFAYDPVQVKEGYKKYRKAWEKRPLVDNWRFASLMNPNDVAEAEGKKELQEDESVDIEISDSEVTAVFGDVPRSSEDREALMQNRNEALVLVGRGFSENDVDLSEGDRYLTEALAQSKDEKLQKEALYFLYHNALKKGNQARANSYKAQLDELEMGYSPFGDETDRASVSFGKKDQDYYGDKYDQAYMLFEAGQYENSYTRTTDMLDTISEAHVLVPKFKLLKAMCVGHLSGRDGYIESLKDLQREHRNTPEGKKAEEMLLILGNATDRSGDASSFVDGELNGFDGNIEFDRHYVLIQLDESYKALGLKNKIEEYHTNYNYPNLKLGFANIKAKEELEEEQKKKTRKKSTCILVKFFEDKDKAIEYYDQAMSNVDEYLTEPESFTVFIASQKNFRKLTTEDRTLEDYIPIFRELYLK